MPCSNVSIVNFEHVTVGWGSSLMNELNHELNQGCRQKKWEV